MARPRKVQSLGELQNLASYCAQDLYMLRYGRSGGVMIRRRAPYKWEPLPLTIETRAPFITVMKRMEKGRALVSRQKVIGFAEVSKQDFPCLKKRRLKAELKGLEIVLWPPVAPEVGAWNQLKRRDASVDQIRAAAKKIQSWSKRFKVGVEDIGGVMYERARQLQDAKKLPHYPRSKRAGSEDKRIQFLAKVIAGFYFGLSPRYATKRLSVLRLTRKDALKWGSLPSLYPLPTRPEIPKQGEKL